MEETYGCNLINTRCDGRQVTEFVGRYHVHVLVRQGQMTFSDGKNSFLSRQGDLAIWQMSNTIQRIVCSDDFEADVLLLSGEFLQQFNPEMVWASKGFVFIRINPSFHLDEEALRLMDDDFALFRNRLSMPDSGFKREMHGRRRHHHRRRCDDWPERAHRHRQPRLPEPHGAALSPYTSVAMPGWAWEPLSCPA